MLPALILFMVIESHMTFWVTAELKLPPRMQQAYFSASVPARV
ncbi:hypothetical protein OHJ21_31215 [Virgibacillus sp. LDC1]|nr:hypothetical protein [Virgibacillus sp. LDC1]